LTINVTEFFRDLNRWEHVRSEILPYLLKNPTGRSSGAMKVWSAGCSTGAEPYTLAMLLEESAPAQKYSILATDLDRGALLKARARGPYTPEDIRNLSLAQRRSHITATPPFYVSENLQRNIRFQEQNLLEDPFENNFDLIVCRNVVIYFTTASKDMLYEKFSKALVSGGILFVGGTEIISTPGKFDLQNFGVSFYRKV
ncbi:MAG TPA: protein-glutamate O-methyltransferase CheR, partial [Anaerolineales bacterium]|nr:protein-glutamate O-methyltransferase CheR [Anaerolineales bacterium]